MIRVIKTKPLRSTLYALLLISVSVFCEELEKSESTFDWLKLVTSQTNETQLFGSFFKPYIKTVDNVYRLLSQTSKNINISEECHRQTKTLTKLAADGNLDALSFFDATGKPLSGLLKGAVSYLGFYSQCIAAKVRNVSLESPLTGMYCSVKLKFRNESNLPEASFAVFAESANKPLLALCLPSSCSLNDVHVAVNESFSLWSGEIMEPIQCHSKTNDVLDVSAICILALILVLIFVSICATIYDVMQNCTWWQIRNPTLKTRSSGNGSFSNEMTTTKPEIDEPIRFEESGSTLKLHNSKLPKQNGLGVLLIPYIQAFSLKTNLLKLLSVDVSNDSVASLHGLRFLSMALIMFGHTYSFASQDLFFRNIDEVSKAPKSIAAQVLSNGTFAVDTFYFISGLLVTLVTLKLLKHTNGKFPLLHFYVHRYLRLTPLFLIVIAFTATLLQYVSTGPNWDNSIMMYSPWCKTNWYLNALYVHNFFNTGNMCLSHSWYLATDMQFYLVTPLIIFPLYKSATWGFVSLSVFLLTTIITTGVMTAVNKFPAVPYINNAESLELVNEYYKQIYIKPYCRMGPYLIGIVVGYILWKNQVFVTRKLYVALGWGLSIFLMVFVIFSMSGANEGHLPSVSVAAAYSALARTAWAVGLGYLVLMCHYGYGGYVNCLLSCRYFIPLSRLTYCAYLIHPVIMAVYYGSVETTVDFSLGFMLYLFIGHCFVTYVISLFLSALFESPIIGIERALRKKK